MVRKPSSRAIIYAGVVGGLTRAQINQLLNDAGFRNQAIPQSTYTSLLRNESKAFLRDPKLLGDFIYHPKPRGWLKKNGYL